MSNSPPEDLSVDYDVIIIGAGLAGLTTAKELKKAAPNTRILIIEAKNRVGGRTLGIEMKGAKHANVEFDIGGQWVGPTQNYILDLIKELNLTTYDQYSEGDKISQIGSSKTRKYSSLFTLNNIKEFSIFEVFDIITGIVKIGWLTGQTKINDFFSWKKAKNLDEITVSKWSQENCWTRTNQDAFDIATRSIFGVEPSRMSMLYNLVVAKSAGGYLNLCECVGDGGQAMKITGGAFQIAKILEKQLGGSFIKLSKAVKNIDVDEHNATTKISGIDLKTFQKFSYSCHHVVCTIPPNQCSKIEWTPSLPSYKKRLFDSCIQGNLIKFIVTFDSCFWKDENKSGEIISTGRTIVPGEVLPIICTYDGTSSNGVPAIVGFINEEYADKPFNERCNAVVSDLKRFLGDNAYKQFIDYKDKIWAHEEYNGGCPNIYIPPGQMDAFQYIREPFYNVHFGGTETATEWIGYMNGAVQSGYRCAHEVLQSMELFSLVSYNYLKNTVYDQEFKPYTSSIKNYNETRSPWSRRLFFAAGVLFGIYAFSRHYRLSIFARTLKPAENRLLKFFFDAELPL